MEHSRSGYTLIEIAIVILIIGLLIGGVLVGGNMVSNADTKRAISMREHISAGLTQFRERYNALPGDYSQAQRAWGSTVTKNGNGDGHIVDVLAADQDERYLFWQHMMLAEAIEGNYNGTDQLPSDSLAVQWAVIWLGTRSSDAALFNGNYGHALIIDEAPFSMTTPLGASGVGLDSVDMSNLDDKLDDGKPATGRIVARLGECAFKADLSGSATATDLDAVYNTTGNAVPCSYIEREVVGR